MAERRMFAKTIIDSDAFLDMPLSSQALYFHLSMRADDEGFINSPKKIQRMIGASDDDLKVLIAKSFIIPFDSGIVVIKHWRIHNYIRADRLMNTKYTEERGLLTIKENGAYTICDDIKEIECMDASDKRKIAYQNSSLPYSFSYKIKRAFEGHVCPICNKKMTSAYKTAMPTIQHNMPISKGGTHELDNISVICESCNTSIRDNETGELNNADVIEIWDKIMAAEKNKIEWFFNPALLDSIDVRQMTDTCQTNDGHMSEQVRLGKDRLGKDRLGKDRLGKDKEEEPPAPAREQKHKHGEYNNVLLTDTELDKLKEAFPDYEEKIDNLSRYIESKGAKYKSHYATILNWARRDAERGYQQRPMGKPSAGEELDRAYAMMADWAESGGSS